MMQTERGAQGPRPPAILGFKFFQIVLARQVTTDLVK